MECGRDFTSMNVNGNNICVRNNELNNLPEFYSNWMNNIGTVSNTDNSLPLNSSYKSV